MIQNLMMLAVWPFLGNLPHPWYRRRMHLLHHRTSGHEEDFEERLIGNGLKFGPLKILAMFEPGLASLFRHKEFRQIPFFKGSEFFKALIPVALVYIVIFYGWILGHALNLMATVADFSTPSLIQDVLSTLNTLAIIFMLPNLIRQVSVQIISSNMHYFGDVDNRLQETQVMNAWWMLPLQLFCCNFGSTHTIHHFYVNQPFYLRLLVTKPAHRAFKTYGIRFNDMETILRGNRYHSQVEP
jgi:fatty acid desaturase